MDVRTSALPKITRPRLDARYPRARLDALLDKALRGRAVWICGPPGCGKTTLASGYAESRERRCLWYRFDTGDDDAPTFFHYLGLAAGKACRGRRKPLPPLTPEYFGNLPAFTRRFFEEVAVRLPAASLLVLENLHAIAADAPLHDLLREGISALPKDIGVILTSRAEPPPALAPLRATNALEVIGWDSLRLTLKETAGIVRLRSGCSAGRAPVAALHRQAGGWVAGLVLLMDGVGAGRELPSGDHTPQEIFDYLGVEVFSRQESRVREFLMKSAFLPRMSASSAIRLTGFEKAGRLLSSMHRNNYFTEKRPGDEPVFEYHALFRKFLLEQAETALSADEMIRIRREAASILVAEGRAEEAFEHLRDTEDWGTLLRLVLTEAPSLFAQGRNREIAKWIGCLPDPYFHSTPWLSLWLGVATAPLDPGTGRRHLEAALTRFREDRDPAGAFLSWSGIIMAIWYGLAGYEVLDSFLPSLEELLGEFGRFPTPEIEARTLCSMVRGLGVRLQGSIDGDVWADRARAVADVVADIPLKAELLVSVANYRLCRGADTRQVEELIRQIQPLLSQRGVLPIIRIEHSLVAAINSLCMAEYDRCLAVVEEGLKHSESAGLHVFDMVLSGQAALAAMHKGDFSSAKETLRRMAGHLPSATPHDASFFHYISSCEALCDGDLARAERHWMIDSDLVAKTGFPMAIQVSRIRGSLLMQTVGNRERALSLLQDARRMEDTHRSERFRLSSKLAEFALRTEEGDDAGGTEALREGLRIGREIWCLGTHFLHPGFLARVAARALHSGIEVPFVREMIRKNRILPAPEDFDREEWPWPVTVRTLGRFELLRDGKPQPPVKKQPQRPLLLLKMLIAAGGRHVPEEVLTDLLWPDAEGDKAHQTYNTTLFRLRQMLGCDDALVVSEGRLSVDRRYAWIDAWAFEQLLDRSAGPVPPGGKIDHRGILEKAIGLYQGEFLQGEVPSPAITSTRERLRGKFLRAIERLGTTHEDAGHWDRALECYHKGLDVDDLAENLYRRVIRCYKATGRTGEAHAAYRRCRAVFSNVLGIAPSPETEALVRSLASPERSPPG